MNITVIGGGAFGAAISSVMAKGGHKITLYSPTNFKQLSTTRISKKLSETELHKEINIINSLENTKDCKSVFLAIPTQNLAQFCEKNIAFLKEKQLIACCKGIDRATGKRPSEILSEYSSQVAVMSGPSFAIDIFNDMPTALVLASTDASFLRQLQKEISMQNFRLYRTSDVLGVELGGALKNIIAIACGIAIGAKQGDSAKAALMARGFSEMIKFAKAHGAKEKTLSGLSGLGDLYVSAIGGRNSQMGKHLGQGILYKDAKEKFGSRAWSSMVVKRLEDKYGISFREKGFPDELVDNEPEEKGQEV